MNSGFAIADYAIVAGFFVVMLCIGVYFANKMKDLRDFFCGSNHVPWWVSGVSLYMTTFSAFAFVSYSALAYTQGLVCITIWYMTIPCALISAWVFAARWRRIHATSPVEYIEHRYGPSLRQGFSWAGVPLIVFDDALKLYVIGKMVTVSMGFREEWAFPAAIVACGTIMLTYTLMGGLWAVMITDFVQFIVMATAVIVLAPLVLIRVGGIGPIFQNAPAGYWSPASSQYSIWWLVPFGLIQVLVYATKWPLVQRYYSVKTDTDARKVGYTVAVLTMIGVPLLYLPAYAARVFMPGVSDANEVYPLICTQLLPVGLLGMVIAGMFSATMSMLSSDYNAVAAVITNDIYKRLLSPFRGEDSPLLSEKRLVLVGRVSTLAVGLVAVAVAVLLSRAEKLSDLVQIMANVFGLLVPPVAIPMAFGLLTRKVSYRGAWSGFLAGTACALAAFILSYIPNVVGPGTDLSCLRLMQYMTWISAVPTFSVMWGVSLLLPDPEPKRREVSRFLDGVEGRTVRTAEPSSEDASKADTATAVRIIGIATIAMGLVLSCAVLVTGHGSSAWLSVLVGAVLASAGVAVWRLAPCAAGVRKAQQ